MQPFVTFKPIATATVTAGAQFLWRNSLKDAVYSPAATPLIPPGGRGHYVARQPYLRADMRLTPLVEVQAGIENAQPGDAYRSFGGGAT